MPRPKLYSPKVEEENTYMTVVGSEVIAICLNCPLPKCESADRCEHFKQERELLRRKKYGTKVKKSD